MRKKIIRMLVTLLAVTTLLAGLGLTANAASSSSTYYFNLQKNTETTFTVGTTLYLTQNSSDLTDADYISYGFPSVLSAEVQVSNPASNAGNSYTGCTICEGGQTQNTDKHWHVIITKKGDLPFDSCNGCITYVSDNKWKYNCYGGAWQNSDVYLYTCNSGTFTASDVTVNFDSNGKMTGATLFKGQSNAFTVPANMISIDSTVNYANGDYTQTATLNGIVITAVDSNAVFNAMLGNSGLTPEDEATIKNLLAKATSDEEVALILAKAEALKTIANLGLDSTDESAVEKLLTNAGTTADVNRVVAQAEALKALEDDETAKLSAINNINGIDYSEKNNRKNDIKEEIENAKKAILNVTDAGLIDGLKQGAINANTLTVEKAQAITEVEQAYKNELAKVTSGNTGLDLSQQNFLALKLQSALNDAKSAINGADIDNINTLKTNGLADIALQGKKADAIKDMKQAAEAALQNLTPAEKAEWENTINDALNNAMNGVLYAENEGQINQIAQNLQNELATIVAKAKALTDVRAKADNVKNAINNDLTYLEGADKTELLQMVADELAKAEANIKNAADISSVDTAKGNGNTALDVVNKKADAVNDIIKNAEGEKADVRTYGKLTGDEIAKYEQDIDQTVADAKAAIYAAEEGEIDGLKTACNEATYLLGYKAYVINNGRNYLDTKCKEIDDNANLTDDDKVLLKQKMADAVAEFEEGITESANIHPSMDNVVLKLSKASDLILQQADAMADINVDAAAKKQAVSDLENIDPADAEIKRGEIEAAAQAAKDAIYGAANNDAIAREVIDGKAATLLLQQKAEALDALYKDAADRIAVFENLLAEDKLTEDEAETLIADIEAARDAAKDVVNAATTDSEGKINTAENNGKEAMLLISQKADAMAEINVDAAAKKQAVKDMKFLTDEEKEAKYAEIDAVAKDAKDAVYGAANEGEINQAVLNGKAAIELVNDKADAMNKVAEDVAAKKSEVEAFKNLTDVQKADLIKEIENEKAASFKAINSAADADEIGAVVTKALRYNKVEAAKAKAIDTVMSQKALTSADKDEFIKNINELAQKAIEDMNNADATADDYSDILDKIISDVEVEIADEVDNAIALDFVKAYVADKDGKVYTSVTSENADQIASGKTTWDAMTDTQKAKIDALIAEANKNVDGAPKSYEDFVASVEKFAENSANDFIKNYLTGTDGNIYKEADRNNYKQILSGLSTWNKLSQTEKDAINTKLVANGGKTYEELLKVAEELEKSPQTGDNSHSYLWMSIMLISLAALVLLYKKKALLSK